MRDWFVRKQLFYLGYRDCNSHFNVTAPNRPSSVAVIIRASQFPAGIDSVKNARDPDSTSGSDSIAFVHCFLMDFSAPDHSNILIVLSFFIYFRPFASKYAVAKS